MWSRSSSEDCPIPIVPFAKEPGRIEGLEVQTLFSSTILKVMDFRESLKALLTAESDYYQSAKEWKSIYGGKVIAHLLPDVPEELIAASGAFPVPVMGVDRAMCVPENHLPSFTCSLISGLLQMALNHELDFIDGMVIPYVCDSTRAFSQIWEVNFPDIFNHTLWLPKKVEGSGVKRFLSIEFLRMKEKLEVFSGRKITETDLRDSIEIYNRNRRLLRELFQLGRQRQTPITFADYLNIVKASMMMPKGECNDLLTRCLERVKTRSEHETEVEPLRIFLFGSVCETSPILSYFDKAGMQVIDDNLYNGTRYFLQDVDEDVAPIDGLVNRQLAKDPWSCFHYPRARWRQYIAERIEANEIQGLVFFAQKDCELMGFDYPSVKEMLHEVGTPILFMETDSSSRLSRQLKTRLEAFAEILRERWNGNLWSSDSNTKDLKRY